MKHKRQDVSPTFQLPWQDFGELLRDRRDAAALSRAELANAAKVSDATIKFIETARHRPSRATLIRLLNVAALKLTWAEVPGPHKPPAEKPDLPALPPQAAPESGKLGPDPAQFLMNLIGFDEICLPSGAPKTLRIFQQRLSIDEGVGDNGPLDERPGKR